MMADNIWRIKRDFLETVHKRNCFKRKFLHEQIDIELRLLTVTNVLFINQFSINYDICLLEKASNCILE